MKRLLIAVAVILLAGCAAAQTKPTQNSSDTAGAVDAEETGAIAPVIEKCPDGYAMRFYSVPNPYGAPPRKEPLYCVKVPSYCAKLDTNLCRELDSCREICGLAPLDAEMLPAKPPYCHNELPPMCSMDEFCAVRCGPVGDPPECLAGYVGVKKCDGIRNAQTKPKECAKGAYLSVDGRCLHDQSGESHPAGDGCNSATCVDSACHSQIATAIACAHGDDPASEWNTITPAQTKLRNKPFLDLDDKCDFLAKDGYNMPCLPSQTLPPVSELDPQCGTTLKDDGRCHSSTFIMGRDCTLRRIKGGWRVSCSWKPKGVK